MSASSSIPGVKDAIYDGLKAEEGLRGVSIDYGIPHERWEGTSGDWLIVGDTTSEQDELSFGARRRLETLNVEVYVDIRRQTTDQKAVTERAFVVAGVVEDWLRADNTLTADYAGEGQIVDAVFGGVTQESSSSADRQRRSVLTCRVRVRARLT